MIALKKRWPQALARTRGVTSELCELCGHEILELTRAPARLPLPRGAPRRGPPPSDVYVLELEGGRVYVGKSAELNRRLRQHAAGAGSVFTRMYPPTGRRLPRLGNVRGAGDAAERDETLRYMHARGLDFVRGWRYTAPTLSAAQRLDAETNIRELFDLCRSCGGAGHFAASCPLRD